MQREAEIAMHDTQIRILIVDDHPVVRLGIATIVNAQPDMTVVAEADGGIDAIAQFRSHQPDLAIMDLRLEGISGVETIRMIRQEFPDAQFVVLTTYQGDEDIHQALEAGANAYLIKGMPRQFLLEAIRSVFEGKRFIPPAVAETLATRKPQGDLSHREMEVLSLLAAGKANKEIASALCIAEITVKCHLSMIYTRLGVTDRTQALVVAVQRGLIHIH